MNGKIFVSGLLIIAAIVGISIYYLQVYGFYDDIDPQSGLGDLIVTTDQGQSRALVASDFQGIDSTSSPLRYRSCFKLSADQAVDLVPFDAPTPLIGPKWFKCFSAGDLDADLSNGAAQAYLAQKDIAPGIDRVIAIYPDGTAFAWHQLNETAEEKKVLE